MLKKDYFTAILEQLARAIRQLLKTGHEKDSETFIAGADRIFEETFGIKTADFGTATSERLDTYLQSDADKKPVTILLLKTAIAHHTSNPETGKEIYTKTLDKIVFANRTFSYIKDEDDIEIEKLLSIAGALYK
jgi:hypothetical protein